jgi:hypothetical protein
MCPANPFSSPATKTNLQQATHQHALLCINKRCCFGINVLKLPTVGFSSSPSCLQILDPKHGFSGVFFFFFWKFFAKREIQIQKVSDYVGFQSP